MYSNHQPKPKKPLWPHQARLVRLSKDDPTPAFFVEMRLGKTRVAIRWAKKQLEKVRTDLQKVLVVTPYSAHKSWQEDLEEEGVSDFVFLSGKSENRRALLLHAEVRWFLINVEAWRCLPEIAELPWSAVILDESAVIRNPKAGITKFFTTHFRHVPFRAILSGNPRPESLLDVFEQMRFLKGEVLGYDNFWKFRNKELIRTQYDWQLPRKTQERLMRWLKERCYFLSRKQVGGFAPKIYTRWSVRPNQTQMRLIKECLKDFAFVNGKEVYSTKWRVTVSTAVRQLCGGFTPAGTLISSAKIEAVWQVFLANGREPLIVWCAFRDEWLALVKHLRSKNLSADYVAGDVPASERFARFEKFNEGNLDVLVCEPRSTRYGCNLSKASAQVFYSNNPSGEIRNQVEDRLVHRMRKDAVLTIDLVLEGTPDELLHSLIRRKDKSARAFVEKRFLEQLSKFVRNKNV